MECRVNGDMIQQYLDGELGRLESIILEEHIKECQKCRKELTQMKLLMFELELLEEITVPDEAKEIREKVIKDIQKNPINSPFSLKKLLNTQKAIIKSSNFYLRFVPGMELIGNSIKRTPALLQRTTGLALTGGIKLVFARAKV